VTLTAPSARRPSGRNRPTSAGAQQRAAELTDLRAATQRTGPLSGHPDYDRARGSLDRHATYIVAAFIAGAAR
jgi:hypothetical protein